jgi:hypothetical protein
MQEKDENNCIFSSTIFRTTKSSGLIEFFELEVIEH